MVHSSNCLSPDQCFVIPTALQQRGPKLPLDVSFMSDFMDGAQPRVLRAFSLSRSKLHDGSNTSRTRIAEASRKAFTKNRVNFLSEERGVRTRWHCRREVDFNAGFGPFSAIDQSEIDNTDPELGVVDFIEGAPKIFMH